MASRWQVCRLLASGLGLLLVATYCVPSSALPLPIGVERGSGAGTAEQDEDFQGRLSIGNLYARLFVANRGQTDQRVAFTHTGGGLTTFFTAAGPTYAAIAPDPDQAVRGTATQPRGSDPPMARWAVGVELLGASPTAGPSSDEPTGATVNVFRGGPEQWVTDIPTHHQVRYSDVWPGINLRYSAEDGRLKSTYLLQPGGDPARVALLYGGATRVRLDEGGALLLETPLGTIIEQAPVAHQEVAGQAVPVPVAYALRDDPELGGTVVMLSVGAYDRSLPLLVDPSIEFRDYGGYIGGSQIDRAEGVAVDQFGAAYVVGQTSSSQNQSFPVLVGPDTSFNGLLDAFIARVKKDGKSFHYIGFIGGSSSDRGTAVALGHGCRGGSCAAYIVGKTSSRPADGFPVLVGPDTTSHIDSPLSSQDAFVAKVKPSGNGLDYSGYIGGDSVDSAWDVAVDGSGAAYVAGRTKSAPADGFPATVGPVTVKNGSSDGFVAKVKPDGSGFVYAGYVGSSGSDTAKSIAVDDSGAAYLAGVVAGPPGARTLGFPATEGPDLTWAGNRDGFVAKVTPDGEDFEYAGYIGGSQDDRAQGVAVEPDCSSNCAAYVVGTTNSDDSGQRGGFPAVVDGASFNGAKDVFAVKIDPDGDFEYARYIGGSQVERSARVAVDKHGRAYVAGRTESSVAQGFPASGGPDTTYNGGLDAFVAGIKPDGSDLWFAGYVGGTQDEIGGDVFGPHGDIAVDFQGKDVYVVGATKSSVNQGFPADGLDSTFAGGPSGSETDGFLVSIRTPQRGRANAPLRAE